MLADDGRKPVMEAVREFAGELKLPSHPPGRTPRNCALLYASSPADPRFKGVIRLAEDGRLYWVSTRLRQTEAGRLVLELELTHKKPNGEH
jgi:hypothetical protein